MPTPTMSDEELDALFRRGAAAYPEDMHPGAWARMEDQLNAAAHAQRLRRKVGRLLAGEAAFICLIIWQAYRFMAPTPPVGPQQRAAAQAATAPQVAGLQATRSQAATLPLGTTTALAPAAAAGRQPAAVAQATARPAPSADASPISTHAAATAHPAPLADASPTPTYAAQAARTPLGLPGKSTRNELSVKYLSRQLAAATRRPTHGLGQRKLEKQAGAQKTGRLAGATIYPAAPALAPAAAGGRAGAAEPADALAAGAAAPTPPAGRQAAFMAHDTAGLAALLPTALPVPGYPLPLPDSLAQRRGLPADSAPRPAPRLPYRLVVGLLGAPSWSAVRTPQSARLGGDYGLTLEYRLMERLRVRAGLLSSRKRYEAASSDYVAPAAWQWRTGDYELYADCRVTEIPLDLRYDVVRRPGVLVFTSLGLNSLLMRDERYSYDWLVNGQTMTKTAQVLRGSNHWLSVLNVSVGVERPLGARWATQVEPYWQFPLGGVGAGQVRLSSAGAYFSLKYSLLR